MLSCKFIVMAGMEISELSQELKWCLRAKLPCDAPVRPRPSPVSYTASNLFSPMTSDSRPCRERFALCLSPPALHC